MLQIVLWLQWKINENIVGHHVLQMQQEQIGHLMNVRSQGIAVMTHYRLMLWL